PLQRQSAEPLVGRNMMESEGRPALLIEVPPVLQRCVEQPERADDIGLDERRWPVDRTVHMALGGEVHDRLDPLARKQLRDSLLIANVGLDETIVGLPLDFAQAVEVAGVGQLVDIDDMKTASHEAPDHRTADEARPAGDQNSLHGKEKPVCTSASSGAARSLSDRINSPSPIGQSMAMSGSLKRIARSCLALE